MQPVSTLKQLNLVLEKLAMALARDDMALATSAAQSMASREQSVEA
jgi:hypothetical protein